MSAPDLTTTLLSCQNPDPTVRTAAEAALASAEQTNLAEFFLALDEVAPLDFNLPREETMFQDYILMQGAGLSRKMWLLVIMELVEFMDTALRFLPPHLIFQD